MSYRYLLTLLGVLLGALGLARQGWFWLACWAGGDFVILGLAHARGAHGVFGKRPDGTLPLWSWGVFWPLLLGSITVWQFLRLFSREPAHSTVTEHLVVGRRVLPCELEGPFDNYVDLTAEFVEPSGLRQSPAYRSFPILDGSAPTPEVLRQAVARLRPGRTFVHCAQGHGRTGLFALAMLLSSGAVCTPEEGLRLLTTVRPQVHLNKEQRRCIQRYAEQVV